MAKYDPLASFLRRQRKPNLEMSFRDIETVINAVLPKSAAHASWWSEPPAGEPRGIQQSTLWTAGYSAELLPGERVRFTERP